MLFKREFLIPKTRNMPPEKKKKKKTSIWLYVRPDQIAGRDLNIMPTRSGRAKLQAENFCPKPNIQPVIAGFLAGKIYKLPKTHPKNVRIVPCRNNGPKIYAPKQLFLGRAHDDHVSRISHCKNQKHAKKRLVKIERLDPKPELTPLLTLTC